MTRQLVVLQSEAPQLVLGPQLTLPQESTLERNLGDHLQLTGEPQRRQGMPLKLTSCPQHSVQQADLPGRVLSLSVWHRESLGRNIFLGEVEVPLDTWNWDSEATWLPLQPRVRAGVQSLIFPQAHWTKHPTDRFAEPHLASY